MTTGDERAQAIRAALDAWNRNYIEDLLYEAEMHSDRMRAADKIEALLNQLRDLLAERDKLRAVMIEVAEMGTLKPDEFTFGHAAAKMCYMRDKLREALEG